MKTEIKAVPQVDATIEHLGIRYRVVSRSEMGCYVEAIDTEVTPVAGRKPRPIHYSEKRATLALSEGKLIGPRWDVWTVIG